MEDPFKSFLGGRRLSTNDENVPVKSRFKGYGGSSSKVPILRLLQAIDHKPLPRNVCLVYNKNRCSFCKHRRSLGEVYKRFAPPYLTEENVLGSGDSSESFENEMSEEVEIDFESYIALTGFTAAIGMSPERRKCGVTGWPFSPFGCKNFRCAIYKACTTK